MIGSRPSNLGFREAAAAHNECGRIEFVVVTERVSDIARLRRKSAKRGASSRDEHELVEALRRGDEVICEAFMAQHHGVMIRLALPYVKDRDLAEDVAQETWEAFVRGLGGFRHRSSLRTWLLGILFKRARSVARREGRSTPASQLSNEVGEGSGDPLDQLFHGQDHPDCGGWAVPPTRWRVSPEDEALARELESLIERLIQRLPDAQRVVITLRDREEWETREVADLLGQTRNWVRVVLCRARLKVREALNEHLEGDDVESCR